MENMSIGGGHVDHAENNRPAHAENVKVTSDGIKLIKSGIGPINKKFKAVKELTLTVDGEVKQYKITIHNVKDKKSAEALFQEKEAKLLSLAIMHLGTGKGRKIRYEGDSYKTIDKTAWYKRDKKKEVLSGSSEINFSKVFEVRTKTLDAKIEALKLEPNKNSEKIAQKESQKKLVVSAEKVYRFYLRETKLEGKEDDENIEEPQIHEDNGMNEVEGGNPNERGSSGWDSELVSRLLERLRQNNSN
ncbi:MAG: hypothetical protein VX777_10075 [Chlamydiota bacterium]|nr:hypothetical protein [Chlamydiota bacterium]